MGAPFAETSRPISAASAGNIRRNYAIQSLAVGAQPDGMAQGARAGRHYASPAAWRDPGRDGLGRQSPFSIPPALGSVWFLGSVRSVAGGDDRTRVRFKVMWRILAIRQSVGFQQMATAKMSGEALFAFLDAHPNLRDRMASIISAIDDSEGESQGGGRGGRADHRGDAASGAGGAAGMGRQAGRTDGTRNSPTASHVSPR